MTAEAGGGRGRRFPHWKGVVGVAISVALLYFALKGVDAGEVIREIRRADPWLMAAAVTAVTSTFAVRAVRWRALLRPVLPESAFRPRFAATAIGFMANNLLPARIGEFARAYALARLERLAVTASFGSLVLERLLDGLAVITLLFAAMALPGFPSVGDVGGRDLGHAARALAAVFAAIGIALLAMVVWPGRVVALFERTAVRFLPRPIRRPVVDALRAFLSGLGALRRPGLLVRASLWSVALWLLNSLGFWLGFRAFGIDVPFGGAVFLQSLIALAVALPAAPGFFGVYEAAVRLGLVEIWGVEVNKALGFAIGFHMATFVPITAIGLYYVWRLGLSWREVGHSEEAVEEAVEAGRPAGGADAGALAPPGRGNA